MKLNNFKILIFLFVLVSVFSLSKAQYVGPVVAMTGNVLDDVTHEPVNVWINVTDSAGKKVNSVRSQASDGGYYYLTGLRPGNKYQVEIKQRNYLRELVNIEIPNTDKYQEISRDFLVKPLQRDAHLKLPVPPFELNKTKLRVGTEEYLMDYVNLFLNNTSVKIEIQCFPDNATDKNANSKLTNDRAKALFDFFTGKGIDKSRISMKGSANVDTKFPPPNKKEAKGKRYIGPSYIVLID